MAHDAELRSRQYGGSNGATQGLEPIPAHHGLGHPHLDSERNVGVLGHSLGAEVDVGILDIHHLADLAGACQADGRDMDKGEETRAGLRPCPVCKAPRVRAPYPAETPWSSRDADQLVGGKTNADMRAEMRVEIDEPRREEPAAGVDALHGPTRGDAGGDRRDLTLLDADVALGTQALARIQHVAIGDDEIELECRVRGIET